MYLKNFLLILFLFLSVLFSIVNFFRLAGKLPIPAANFILMAIGYTGVNDRPNGATHDRRNGATLKWQNWGLGGLLN
jgi:Na+/H+ antiporter NhaC